LPSRIVGSILGGPIQQACRCHRRHCRGLLFCVVLCCCVALCSILFVNKVVLAPFVFFTHAVGKKCRVVSLHLQARNNNNTIASSKIRATVVSHRIELHVAMVQYKCFNLLLFACFVSFRFVSFLVVPSFSPSRPAQRSYISAHSTMAWHPRLSSLLRLYFIFPGIKRCGTINSPVLGPFSLQ